MTQRYVLDLGLRVVRNSFVLPTLVAHARSRDIFLYEDAIRVIESKGFCGQFFRYGDCRNRDKCKLIHERPNDNVYDELPRVYIQQTSGRPESPHPEARPAAF